MRTAFTRLLAAAAVALAATAALPASAASPTSALARLHIGHVWLVNIENTGFDSTYTANPNAYLSRTLPAQGQLLTQYFGIGHQSLDNYLAEISGQAPTMTTQADCAQYVDQQPGVPGPDGQSLGQGCVYPAWVKTLPDQLTAKRLTWKGYMEDMGNDDTREPDRCGAPGNPTGAGFPDGTQKASKSDQYAARHNPFVYFHSILDSRACWTNVVPLTVLKHDLASVRTTPAFSLITPNLCHDGHDAPCADGEPGGLVSVDRWLRTYIPLIQQSPAFRKDGLIIVTADEADSADASSCCHEPSGYNTPMPGVSGPGGGRIGAVVVGRCVRPGSRNDTPYNHYALLRSLEDLFGITTGGADGHGHLGYAGQAGLKAFGADVFGACGGSR